jgi:hypothetical protein
LKKEYQFMKLVLKMIKYMEFSFYKMSILHWKLDYCIVVICITYFRVLPLFSKKKIDMLTQLSSYSPTGHLKMIILSHA